MWAAIVNILFGLWLMISPSFIKLEKAASDNNYIVVPLVITFAITALWEVNRSARYFTLMAGAWLILSPFILSFESSFTIWITVAAGVLIAVFSLVRKY